MHLEKDDEDRLSLLLQPATEKEVIISVAVRPQNLKIGWIWSKL
ncbi:hypothetical protein [uncultured Pontibacter sp.]|nr:hypothetical protein [uncultured Pontibacter sp.]